MLKLRRCPFTGEEHDGGGPYAIKFDDGGIYFECPRSSHGPMKETIPPPRRTAAVPVAGMPARLRLIPKGKRNRTR